MFRSEALAQAAVPDHTGEWTALTPIVAPPREVGALLSCSVDVGKEGLSDARQASLRRARAGRIWFACVGGIAALLFATLAKTLAVGALVGGLVAAACYLVSARFIRGAQTTFVGQKGLARLRHGDGDALEILSFAEVEGLRVGREARQASMAFSYVFERAGKPAFRIIGSHPLTAAREADAFSDHPLWFALAAEQAYVEYRLPRLLEAIEHGGAVRFEVNKREAITARSAGLELAPASGGVHSCAWAHALSPRANGEMVELMAARGPLTQKAPSPDNPFAAPEPHGEMEAVIFRGSELSDVALLVALIEHKRREWHSTNA